MTLSEIRARYFEYFKTRKHVVIQSVSLVPENDPTTLFVSSGMQPLLPFFLGQPHPQGTRVVNVQPSFRSEDIEEIGDNRHTTTFEMLGNWSFGDYFKKEQLSWFFEFLIDIVGLDPHRLYVTVFMGDATLDIPKDEESIGLWKELFSTKGIDAKDIIIGSEARGYEVGMQGARIFAYDAKKNWWSRSGPPEAMPSGEPGGPDSEVFYDFATPHDPKWGKECHPNCDCGRFMEIGNSVFMQYLKTADGRFSMLPRANVDFGGGLERIAAASVDKGDIFLIDTLLGTIRELEAASGKEYSDRTFQASFRVIADHMKAAVFMIADGVLPSNTEQGYILRRLLRRSVRHMDKLDAKPWAVKRMIDQIITSYDAHYPKLSTASGKIVTTILEEEKRFRKTVTQGMKEFEKLAKGDISGADAFILFSTYGFPIELTLELAKERGIGVDLKGYKIEMQKHQDISRTGSELKFKGGLADHSEISIKYHTATHLLHKALRDTLGPEAVQKGSNITPARLRFDFAFGRKMTPEEIVDVEKRVNERIREELPVTFEDLPLDVAQTRGAIGLFEEKYGDKVRVYKIGDYSLEFCGGPHVKNTSELGEGGKRFVVQKEEAVASGIRRIKAMLV